jgi:ubiquinone/menaquinone biosynthesis C-methylase UbiE
MPKGEKEPNSTAVTSIKGEKKFVSLVEGEQRGTTALWTKRPAEVTRAIADTWDSMDHFELPSGYLYIGRGAYMFGNAAIVSTDMVIDSLLTEAKPADPLQILDVGTGNGLFLKTIKHRLRDKVEVYGMTAHDYRDSKNKSIMRGLDYKIANAEQLLENYPPNSFDLIVSNKTMRHLIDPLGDMAQMYEALKPNGVLAVDKFKVNGINDDLKAFIDYLSQQGYAVVADYEYEFEADKMRPANISTLLIRKTHEHLRLPIEYSGLTDDGKANYILNIENIDPAERLFPLPETLESLRAKIAKQYPNKENRELYENMLFAEVLIGIKTLEGDLDSYTDKILERWNTLCKDGKGMNGEELWLAEEIRGLIPDGISDFVSSYRNKDRFIEEVNSKLNISI